MASVAFSEPQCEAMFELSALRAGGDTSPPTPTPLGCQGGQLVQVSSRFPLKKFEPDKSLIGTVTCIPLSMLCSEG